MSDVPYEGIAIIGMAGRFPGAQTVEEFWANLLAGKETVSFFSDEELASAGIDAAKMRSQGRYIPARGVLADADCFDAAFFGVHPKEAEVTDPQQRVFLEACWTAMERAGYAPTRVTGSVGVFAGATFNTYQQAVLAHNPDLIDLVGHELVMFGNEKDYLTTRVAYKLGLKGPALNVATACSTSLVAIGQACQSLLTYQCDMALAGGVSVTVPQQRGYYHDEGNIGSADGHTRSFDAQATGTTFGNGVGVVVLKRLDEAVKDGDLIYAVIKGAALNNDGSQRVSFGAPGVEGQSEVIAMAHALAGVDPQTITMLEAHGTATPLGDPIEIAAATKAFRLGTDARQFCALGSVKTNTGHLDAAAGVTGLIKTALSLHHKTIPASLHFTRPNAKLDLENSPFYVNSELRDWKTEPGTPRRAGVSSFGTGGTNAHVVLEEAPELPLSGPSRPWQLLPLSAKTPEALDRATAALSAYLTRMASGPSSRAAEELADAAFTLQTGRSEFVHRRVVASSDAADGAAALAAGDPKRVFTHHQELLDPPVVFMFPGQGAQYAGMGAELYRSEPVFRSEVDRCAEILQPHLKTDIRTLLFPAEGSAKQANELLTQTRFTQPALFVIEYALAKLWMSWGVKPAAMIGHSVGEYVAGCLAGVFSLADALWLVARRAELVQAQPGGGMLSVRLPESEILPHLNGHLAVAAANSPNLCVIAGPHEAIQALEEALTPQGVVTRRLHTSHAFHSQMMDPVLAPFTALLRQVELNDPAIPYVSNVTARWITAEEAKTPEYWAGHVRQTVRFADGVAELLKDPRSVFLEVGPGHTLTTLARQHPARPAAQPVFASMPVSGDQELRGTLETLGRLWMTGVNVDWQAFYVHETRHRTVLPTYPFERKRYWPEPATAAAAPSVQPTLAAPVIPAAEVTPPSPAPAQPVVPRKERMLGAARALFQDLSGYDLSAVDPASDLLELGLDSLLLTQAATLFQRKFGVAISFRQLMEELSTLDAIASHLDAVLPPEADPAPAPVSVSPAASAPVALPVGPSNSVLEQLLAQQQQLTQQLLQLLGRPTTGAPAATLPAPAVAASPSLPALTSAFKSHGPFKPIDRAAGMSLSAEQTRFLEALIARYTKRTPGSKKLAEENRPLVADPRSGSGFKQLWKEMVYPIYTNRSDGSKVWDVDGNQYVDFVMGFGASMFGHRPPFVVRAIHEQLDLGFEIGPIHPLVGEVAALVREFTGMQRVGFTNTGSEAVLAATRISRTVTGRDKIAVFAGAYHGIFDEVLFRPLTINGETRTAPIAPGIPDSALREVIVLDYGNPESLAILRARGSEIAAVLVEPVQSRRLDLQPREFLHQLRSVTKEIGSALIFDEVVTGFRVDPGGAQAHFGVRADIATYGKVIGGGVSIGVVAGDPKFMDALDGGKWNYGDTSFPEVGVTFFAGTFVRHPLALAAAKAVLTHLKENGPELQRKLAQRTEVFATQLRAIVEEFQAPYHLTQFSSLIHLSFPAEQKFAGLLFYLLRERGIHVWENRLFVMTTAHSDDDLASLATALRDSLAEMRAAGFFGQTAVQAAAPRASGPPQHTGTFPLTEAQKEVWLAAQMGGEAAVAYNESLRLDFRGAFDVDVFRTALQRVVDRHPILFATFSPDGQTQTVPLGTKLDVPLHDLTAKDERDREQALAGIIQEEISTHFDLATGPLFQVRIARLTSEHHVAVWTAHHIVCDGWSAGVLLSELSKIYSALKTGTHAELETPLSFKDYVAASNNQTGGAKAALEYWSQQFAELPPPLDLPTDRPRPPVRSARAATLSRSFDASLHQALKQAAGRQRTTLVVLLMAALKTLLHRLSGETDVVVGLGVAGQAVTGSDCLVGHCVNLLPIRTRVQPDASFRDNLMAVKKNVLDAFDHHQSTIGELLQHLRIPRSTGRAPLVEVIFNIDREPTVEFQGLQFSCDRNPKQALLFDLFFNFVEGPHGLRVECDFNTDVFDPATLERWLTHFQTLATAIVDDATQTLGTLPILTPAEYDDLVVNRNRGFELPKGETLHGWFERQVERTPSAPALTFEGARLTYRELNRRANQVAHYLKKLGVGPDVLVGILVERSVEMVVGILGILKAGGAYVPIDPVYPKDRIAFLLEDAKVPVVLTQSALLPELSTQSAKIICFDADASLFEEQPESNPDPSSTPDHLAYVIYTSGSTGTPKGSLVTHYNVVRLMQATEAWYQFDPQDVWTLFHSHAFDFSVWELWGALLYGGRLVVVPYLVSRSPADFYELLVAEQVTVLNQTPSAFRQLMQVQETHQSGSHALRYIIFGGEALEMESLEPWFQRNGDQKPQLVNMYGITETTVHVTYRPLRHADVKSNSVVGVPIPDLQVYILDPYGKPAPIGVKGEIYVGGAGVARGYLNRQELTRQKFVPDTFTNRSGALLYRSGDLARSLANHDIEYLGRIDDQVKIRGFRIELGEVEAALSRHPAVAQCVVVTREVTAGDKRLVAYCRPAADQDLAVADLRDHLKRDLPDYMIPSSFIIVDGFRLTAHGKIDRKALPAPSESQLATQAAFAAPRDTVEQMLCQLWSRILRVKRVGLNDNFFELGGHSLLAVRIIVEIEKLFAKRLPLATLLQAPTVAQLSEVLRKEHWAPSWASLVPIKPGGSKPPLFLIHSHGGNVLEYYPVANLLAEDQPVYALQARGLDGQIQSKQTIEEIAQAYLAEIRSLQPQGPYFIGGFCFGGLVALEAAQQLTASGEKVGLLVLIQTVHPASELFSPDTSPVGKLLQRTAKRIDLEQDNLSHRGSSYISERLRRVWDVTRARVALALEGPGSAKNAADEKKPMRVILESLGVEHDRAYSRYRPQAYSGDVVLLRAAKQLPGLAADPQLGWKGILDGRFETAEIPGHQQNMMIPPYVSQLVHELEPRLCSAQRRCEWGDTDAPQEAPAAPDKSTVPAGVLV